MRYLSDYMEKENTKTFDKYEAFYAFSQKRFEEKANKDLNYVSLPGGLCCPKDLVKALIDELYQNRANAIALDLKENGIDNVIQRELDNYECSCTRNTEPAWDALEDYPGITREMVKL